jgi:ferritin-like metal-binding protein YciE
MKTLDDAFRHTLKDVYYAENALARALPKVAKAVSNKALKAAIEDHLEETKRQVKTLEKVFKSVGEKASGEKCDAIDGLIKETEGIIEDGDGAVALNAAVIAAAQAVEHYEITRYGSLIAWATRLGRGDAARVLEQTLKEEKVADQKLTKAAESKVNLKAAS